MQPAKVNDEGTTIRNVPRSTSNSYLKKIDKVKKRRSTPVLTEKHEKNAVNGPKSV